MGAGPTAPRGQYIVMPTASARTAAWSLCENRRREYQLLRRHAFKLIHWPTGNEETGQHAFDIDWDWIKSLEGKRVGELRIDEHINGHNNVRVIFFKANKPLPDETLCRIWLLTVFQKKRQQFTNTEIRSFKAMRDLIVIRHYDGDSQAYQVPTFFVSGSRITMSTITTPNEILAAGASQFAMFFSAYRECSPEIQEIIHDMTAIVGDPDATADEQRLAAHTLIEALFPALTADVHDQDETLLRSQESQQIEHDLDLEEETFSERVRTLMAGQSVTQETLAELTGVSQPAIANILARHCRPQRRTVVRFAAALGVEPSDLWQGFVQ